MHPHFAAAARARRFCTSRTAAALAAAAFTLAIAFVIDALASGSTAHAAETSHAESARERKAVPRKKSRVARDAPYGREGDPRKATRTIRIEMSDAMRYFPDHVAVKRGHTVRFILENAGEFPHEMVIGTMDDLKKHAALIRRQGEDGPPDAPNVVHVAPGRTGTLVWQFTRAGEFYYGCLVPGHFDAGMIGTIVVRGANR
jgi:uncharacterized cupredoxin-like copper-binding protein